MSKYIMYLKLVFFSFVFCGVFNLFATGVRLPLLRSTLYTSPKNQIKEIKEKPEVLALKEKIENDLKNGLVTCLKYRKKRAEGKDLTEKQLKKLRSIELGIEDLQKSLASEKTIDELSILSDEMVNKLKIEFNGFSSRCDEILEEIGLLEDPHLSASDFIKRRNSNYFIATSIALASACLGHYVLRKNEACRKKESEAYELGAAPLTEEEKKARAKKNAIPFLRKYSPKEFKDTMQLGFAVACLVFGFSLSNLTD